MNLARFISSCVSTYSSE